MDKRTLNLYKSGAEARKETSLPMTVSPDIILELVGCIEKSEKQLTAYAAFLNGSITRAELDEVLNDET